MKMLIVLDVDGTLYDLNDVVAANYEMQVEFLAEQTGKPRQEIVEYLEANCVFPVMCEKSRSATELFARDGFSAKDWNAFREGRFPVDEIDISKAATSSDVAAFREFGWVVLLSSNSYVTISHILERLAIPVDVFDAVVCSDRYSRPTPFVKIDAMADQLARFGVSGESLLSIGDRFNTDIGPALELGGSGVLVRGALSLSAVVRDLAHGALSTGNEYEFFERRSTE